MTEPTGATLWIVGTSVSIEDGGYVTQLTQRAPQLGISVRNLSVGDQTSVMGYMRVLAHRDEMCTGDIVVWEYSLLDTLLAKSAFFADDVNAARRMAWQCILESGADLIVLLTAPKKYRGRRSRCEARIARDAELLNLPCIDTRDLFFKLGIQDSRPHYRDDRHPRTDSPLIAAMADAILRHALAPSRPSSSTLDLWSRKNIRSRWQWLGADALAKLGAQSTRVFANSLVHIDAMLLAPEASTAIPVAARIVGFGVVSTHSSGGIWCGHRGCLPASTRLPARLAHEFLLRATAIPCLRRRVSSIASAGAHAYEHGTWADYGQEPCCSPGEIAVFGILFEIQSDSRSRFRALIHFHRQRLRNFFRRVARSTPT